MFCLVCSLHVHVGDENGLDDPSQHGKLGLAPKNTYGLPPPPTEERISVGKFGKLSAYLAVL